MKWILTALILTALSLYALWPESTQKTNFIKSDVPISFVQSRAPLDNTVLTQGTSPQATILPATPSISPHKLTSPTDIIHVIAPSENKPADEYSFFRFTQTLQKHLKQGVSLTELKQAYEKAKAQHWPIDWIFIAEKGNQSYALNDVIDLHTNGFYKQNIFILDISLEPLSNTERISQQKAFKTQLDLCANCVKPDFLFDFLISQGPRLMPGIQSPLALATFNDTIASELAIPLAMGNLIDLRLANKREIHEEKLAAALRLKNTPNRYLSSIGQRAIALLENDEDMLAKLITDETAYHFKDYFKIAHLSLVLPHNTIYAELNRRLAHKITPSDINLIIDTLNFHAQYYSINEALRSLNALDKQHDISQHPIWMSLNRATQEGFSTLGEKWNFEVQQHSRLYEGIFDRKGNPINTAKLNLMLISKLSQSSNLNKTIKRWRKSFQSSDVADDLFAQLNWSLLTPKGFPQEGISAERNYWLKNITALHQHQQNTLFDTVSTQHWQLVNEVIGFNFLKIKPNKHSKKVIQRILEVYPKLLPSEKEWIDKVLIENELLW